MRKLFGSVKCIVLIVLMRCVFIGMIFVVFIFRFFVFVGVSLFFVVFGL